MKSLKTVSQRRTSKYLWAVRVGERRIPKKIIQSKRRYAGICEVCENAQACVYRRDSRNPVLNCAEFKAVLPEQSIYAAQNASVEMNVYAAGAEDTEYRGLCTNCEHRKTCIYPKPEGGVWACEEYE